MEVVPDDEHGQLSVDALKSMMDEPGIVTFTVDGHDSRDVARDLADAGINVSASVAEYARWDLAARRLPALVRASVHYFNTEAEPERLCEALPPPRPAVAA